MILARHLVVRVCHYTLDCAQVDYFSLVACGPPAAAGQRPSFTRFDPFLGPLREQWQPPRERGFDGTGLLSHPVLDAAELTCIPEALVRFMLLGWECRCLSGLRPGGPAALSVPVRVCVKAVLASLGWPSFWTFLNPALCIPVALLCPGQQPYCGPGIAPGPGDTPGLRFWRGDGWCLQGGAAGARICVSLRLVTSWASVLSWAFRGDWSAGQRRQSPPRGPAAGAGSHSPPAAFPLPPGW